MRGIIGRRIELPCMVHGEHYDVYWLKKNEWLNEAERIRFHWESSSKTYMMTIEPAREEDSGAYRCVVETAYGQMSKTFHLEMLAEDDPEVDWRWDSRCGRNEPILGITPRRGYAVPDARCDGEGTYPCCSDHGWCGFSADHCDCSGCIDYSRTQ